METRFISKKQVIKGIYLFLLSFKPFFPNWGGGGGGGLIIKKNRLHLNLLLILSLSLDSKGTTSKST